MDEAPFNEQRYLIHLTELLPDPKLMKAQSLVRTLQTSSSRCKSDLQLNVGESAACVV